MVYVRMKSFPAVLVVDEDYRALRDRIQKAGSPALFIEVETLSADDARTNMLLGVSEIAFIQETTPEDVKQFWEHVRAQAQAAREGQLTRPNFIIPPGRPRGH